MQRRTKRQPLKIKIIIIIIAIIITAAALEKQRERELWDAFLFVAADAPRHFVCSLKLFADSRGSSL